MRFTSLASPRILAPALAALALAACGAAEEEEVVSEADVEDVSGGELIVSEEDPDAVPVDTPDTPMTPVPVDEEEAAAE